MIRALLFDGQMHLEFDQDGIDELRRFVDYAGDPEIRTCIVHTDSGDWPQERFGDKAKTIVLAKVNR